MPRYRVTRKDNPSELLEGEFDDVHVAGGEWVLRRTEGTAADAGQSFGPWSVSAHTVEVSEHGGTWVELEPSERERA